MGYEIKKNQKINPRTARKAFTAEGVAYVVADGAPRHYISGFGIVGPGDVVTLDASVKPGKYLTKVTLESQDVPPADPPPPPRPKRGNSIASLLPCAASQP